MAKAIIQIFVTRKGQFQAEITESINGKLQAPKQILIGGNRWNNGEVDIYKERIYIKVRELITNLHIQSEKI